MKKSIINIVLLLVLGLFLGCVPVRADVIWSPTQMVYEVIRENIVVVLIAIVVIVLVTIGVLRYLKKDK